MARDSSNKKQKFFQIYEEDVEKIQWKMIEYIKALQPLALDKTKGRVRIW